METNIVVGVVLLIILWGLAALIMWGAVATGQYFFSQGAMYAVSSPGTKLGYEIGGVLIPLLFIAPFSLAFFLGGFGAFSSAAFE